MQQAWNKIIYTGPRGNIYYTTPTTTKLTHNHYTKINNIKHNVLPATTSPTRNHCNIRGSNLVEEFSYIIIEFTDTTVLEDHICFHDRPYNCIQIPIATNIFDKHVCSFTTKPLHIYIAITIHKSQGMTIGSDQIFESVLCAMYFVAQWIHRYSNFRLIILWVIL